jgi:PAS domain S-box-containing protein
VNDAFCRMLGYSREELMKLNVVDWDTQIPATELRRMLEDIFSTPQVFETVHRRKDGQPVNMEISRVSVEISGTFYSFASARDITERKRAEKTIQEAAVERERLVRELQSALESITTLQGLLPICSNCKKIRDDAGTWNQLEEYIIKHSGASFTHGVCPECMKLLYGDSPGSPPLRR